MPFKTCGPNEIMVISGVGYDEPFMIKGGRKFVFNMLQKVQKLNLNVMTIMIHSPRIYTKVGVPLSATGVAQVKIISNSEEKLKVACSLYLDMTPDQISNIAKETLEGHQRAIMGLMTVEEIYMDRTKFASSVFEVASRDLYKMGLSVVSYTIKELNDDEGYLESLGRGRTAQIQRNARIGEAEAGCEASIKQAQAQQAETVAKLQNKTNMARAKRDYALKQAEFDKEVKTRDAQSQMAYELQAAKTKQQIKEEEMQIRVVEREQQISVQELEIQRRDRELDAQVRKPAEAEKFRMERMAEAERTKLIREAEATAETIRLRGEAEASAIEAKAKAEAEQMQKKAEAWQDYTEAARLDMLLSALPKLAAEIAQPLMGCAKITMIANGDSNVGIEKVSDEILGVMERIPTLVQKMAGVDLFKMIKTN